MSQSFELAKQYLNKEFEVLIEIPKGERHAEYKNHVYEVDYGSVEGVIAPDGENLDAYYITNDVLARNQKVIGRCIAIIHRLDDDDDKLIVVPPGINLENAKIDKLVNFQEKFYKHEIIRQL